MDNITGRSVEELPDEVLIPAASNGDSAAFSQLYEKYVRRIFNYVYYRTGNVNEAEDLTERVFLRAYGHIQNYRDMGLPFSAWLYRIAHNLVANWHRDTLRRQELSLDDHIEMSSKGEHAEVAIIKDQETERLMSVLRELPEDRQQLIILKFVEHLSNAEIAVIMQKSEGAVKSLYHRTLIQLRTRLDLDVDGEVD